MPILRLERERERESYQLPWQSHTKSFMDEKITDNVDINRWVPQGAVLGPLLFPLMGNDIKLVNSNNRISKYADDISMSVPFRKNSGIVLAEVKNLESWAANNGCLNLAKTWEMLLCSISTKPSPPPVLGIERKEWLKIFWNYFQ